ncbi:hypothetical protein EXW51_00370 (plasmid) [Bacillus mycoides]|uniref:hypothetical protein n=1 Tax=Bacillus mycoides TaxID=1405 RepID=UPI001C00A3DF|nr:hypothetical protein [Bacillus mycoides]QWH26571.1 hypothetical protein EXW51_00370 [Bacillus mycoides]
MMTEEQKKQAQAEWDRKKEEQKHGLMLVKILGGALILWLLFKVVTQAFGGGTSTSTSDYKPVDIKENPYMDDKKMKQVDDLYNSRDEIEERMSK